MIHNSFFQAICRVGIFMICAQAIIHFRPNESYEKYLKLLMSVMVLIQLFVPALGFFFGGGGEKARELMGQFEKELADGIREAQENAREADRLLERMTLEEVRRRAEEAKEAQDALQGGASGGAGTAGNAGTAGGAGTAGNAGTAGGGGAAGNAEAGASGGAGEIRIELDGVEPIRIGQEE